MHSVGQSVGRNTSPEKKPKRKTARVTQKTRGLMHVTADDVIPLPKSCVLRQPFQSLFVFPRPNSTLSSSFQPSSASDSPSTPFPLPKLHYFSSPSSSFTFVLKANRGEKRAEPYPRGEVMSKTQGRVAAQLMGLSSPS